MASIVALLYKIYVLFFILFIIIIIIRFAIHIFFFHFYKISFFH
jgi:hypothetical protein